MQKVNKVATLRRAHAFHNGCHFDKCEAEAMRDSL